MLILFSERARQLRKEAGLSQTQLAQKLGITQRKLSYLESGQSEPDMETLCRMADFFDVTTDYLLGRTEY
ncbi:MAG TPA: helix-turn-helix domain-containing protein [Candidatus Borkfalkia excrementipullorum]|nr:helix-turn-helix domain-containing protein [Candidatus Borkfalkia excrementipullorum]